MRAGTDFVHVIMTRFNMATPGHESKLRNRPGWLERRFDLFETFCLPTIAAQTCHDFEWIIYFDEGTPDPIRERIEENRKIQRFTPYYTGLFGSDGWRRSIREVISPNAPWLLTTRLDNDDGLAKEYVGRLHSALAALTDPGRRAFNFSNGFVFQSGRLYRHRHLSNAFASWLESWDAETRTAHDVKHMELSSFGPVTQIDGDGAWLQVIHDENVSNKIRGWRTSPSTAHHHFPAKTVACLNESSATVIILENVIMIPLRGLRDGLLGFCHRLKKVIQSRSVKSKADFSDSEGASIRAEF